MKTSIKGKIYEFLVITLKHVNRHGAPKLWAIAHENGHKTQVFVMPHKHVKRPETLKL